MYAIIAGTGFDKVVEVEKSFPRDTPYGQAQVYEIKLGNKEAFYLPRHGLDHSLAPHKINYRANGWALKSLGVDHVLSLCAVGSLSLDYRPGDLVLVQDIIDFTKSRVSTYFDGDLKELAHLDVSEVYSKKINQDLKELGSKEGLDFKEGVYVATEGPRFETPSEVKFYGSIGGDLVGMTGAPEAFLIRELSMTYNSIAYVTNLGTGLTREKMDLATSFSQVYPRLLSLFSQLMDIENTPKEANFL